MPRDKSWVLLDDRRLEPYRKGCLEFLEHAFKYAAIEDRIRCPCRDCRNKKFGNYEFVHNHLLWRGMCKLYGQGLWTSHNECEDHYHGDVLSDNNANEDDGLGVDTGVDMDTGTDTSDKSKSQKCKDARKANKMNHCLGRTSLIKWKDKHIDELGKPPNVAQTFDKAYLRIDPLEHHGSSNSNQDVESDPWTGITNNPEVRRVSEELHKFYEKAIVEGNEETNANTQSLLNVFGRSTRLLGHVSSRSNNERSKRASSSNKGEIEMLREKVAEAEKKRKGEKRKRKELESKIGVLMACMQNHGMLPLDDNHSASNSHHTESSEDENIDK